MSTIIATCPVCGGPLFDQEMKWFPKARTLVAGSHVAVFSVLEARFFQFLWRARHAGEGVEREAALAFIYRHKGDGGGPDSPNALSMLARSIRAKTAKMNLSVDGNGSNGARYRLLGR